MSDFHLLLWQEINTFDCPHGLGRISPEQCKANRQRPKNTGGFESSAPLQPAACSKCTQFQEMCNQVYIKRQADNKPTRKCRVCKKKRPLAKFRKSKVTGNHIKTCDDCEHHLGLGKYKMNKLEVSSRSLGNRAK